MPVGPLAVYDGVPLVLSQKVGKTHRALDERLEIDSNFGAYNTASRQSPMP